MFKILEPYLGQSLLMTSNRAMSRKKKHGAFQEGLRFWILLTLICNKSNNINVKKKEIKVDFKSLPFQIIQMFVFIDLMRGLLMASGFPSHLAHGSYIMTWKKF